MIASSTISSVRDGTRLTFFDVSPGAFAVRLENTKFSGETSVSTYHSGSPATFFGSMASSWDGWAGSKDWASLEDELRLAATVDMTGHISLRVVLRNYTASADWHIEATLELESGSLQSISRSIDRLFASTKPVEPTE